MIAVVTQNMLTIELKEYDGIIIKMRKRTKLHVKRKRAVFYSIAFFFLNMFEESDYKVLMFGLC